MLHTTISGSFRKHLTDVTKVISQFNNIEVKINSPRFTAPKNPGDEFILFEGEETEDPKTLENIHLKAISTSDFLYVVNPNGYIGNSTVMEIGYAISRGIPVYSMEKPEEAMLNLYIEKYGDPKEIIKYHTNNYGHRTQKDLPKSKGLIELQHYIHEKVKSRGFDDESPKDLLVLLMEEVGEFAKALRKYSGIKVDEERAAKYPALQEEIADVLIYIVDLANTLNIDLDESYRLKEESNDQRFWSKHEQK